MEYCRKSREEYIKRIVKRKKNNSKNNVTFIEKEIKKTPPLDIINHSLYKNITSFIKIFKMLNKLLERYDKTLIPITITFNYFINKFIYSFLESIFSNKIEDVIRSNNKIILCIKKILNNNFKVD